MIGVPLCHKGLKPCSNGSHLLMGTDCQLQMWSMLASRLEMVSHSYRFMSCYAVNYNGS